MLDFDEDGDSDLVVMAARSSPQLRLFRNDLGSKNASLAVRLTGKTSDCPAEPKARPAEAGSPRCAGTSSNRDAVGARVTVVTDTLKTTKIVQAGSGFISQHSKELLFGLGQSRGSATVEIQWPSGAVQTLTGLEVNQRIFVEEGNDSPRKEPFRSASVPGTAPATAVPTASHEPTPPGTWLYRPVPAPDFTGRDFAGQEHSLSALHGKPALLLFWSLAAPPSRRALEDLAAHRPAFAAAGVPVLAVSVDTAEEEPKVREAATGLALPTMLAGRGDGGRLLRHEPLPLRSP